MNRKILEDEYRWNKFVKDQSYNGRTFRGARVARIVAGGKTRVSDHYVLLLDGTPPASEAATYLKKEVAWVGDVYEFSMDSDVGPLVVYVRLLSGDAGVVERLESVGPLPASGIGAVWGPFNAEAQVFSREYILYGYRCLLTAPDGVVEIVGLLLADEQDAERGAQAHANTLAERIGAVAGPVELHDTGWTRPVSIQLIFRSKQRKVVD